MSETREALAIIPARGGSKGLPGKNVRLLDGRPLIGHSILAALEAPSVTRVIVSTEAAEIAEVAMREGAEVPFLRPLELSQDETPTLDVLRHVLLELEAREGYRPEEIVLLQPTSPLRTYEDIEGALALRRREGADRVVSVTPVKHHPSWMFHLDEHGRAIPYVGEQGSRRQDLSALYALNGAVYVYRREHLLRTVPLPAEEVRLWVMEPETSVDIDTLLDFELAEFLLARRRSR